MRIQNLTSGSGPLEVLVAGQDVTLNVTVADEAGAAKDLSGATVSLAVSGKLTKAGVVTNGPAGQCAIVLTAAETTQIGAGQHHYQIWVTDALDKTAPVAGGILKLVQNVASAV